MTADADGVSDERDALRHVFVCLWRLSRYSDDAVPPDGGTDEYVRGFQAGQARAADLALDVLTDQCEIFNWNELRTERKWNDE